MRAIQVVHEQSSTQIQREAAQLAGLFQEFGLGGSLQIVSGPDAQIDVAPEDVLLVHFDMNLLPPAVFDHPGERLLVLLQDYVDPDDFDSYDTAVSKEFSHALRHLRSLARVADTCVSHVNEGLDILEENQARRVRKIPLFLNEHFSLPESSRMGRELFSSESRHMISVGEVDVNSGLEDLYSTAWYYNRFCEDEQHWQLVIAGRLDRCLDTGDRIKQLNRRFELAQFDVMHCPDDDEEQLAALFDAADVYLGFDAGDLRGEGLLRAIAAGIPALGISSGASADIIGDGELLIEPMTHSAAAERIHRVIHDQPWRQRVMSAQRQRLSHHQGRAVTFLWQALLSKIQ